ncbi:MAG: FtsX-like permease family protein [Pseudomonas sp.]|uniref:ABC transporter permease n=1 Tax=Pseudomonas abieticivorans TaxID=2931382 RepID=UPI0020BE0DCC|nr:FtsX-like permease family protein [Pseudomonas sp. PIA16]MDE1164055.1 FtsX-like permease family protein [Pseudomonas sp.]
MKVLYWTLRALLSHWRKHPVQFFSVFAGLWLATALLIGVQALNGQARQSYAQASQLIGGQPQARLVLRQGGRFTQQAFVDLRLAGVPVSPVLQGRISVNGQSLQVLGIEPLTLPHDTSLAGEVPDGEGLGRFIGDPGQTWAAPQTLRSLAAHDGDQPQAEGGQRLPPLLTKQDMAPGLLLMDIDRAQALLLAHGQISSLLLPAHSDRPLPAPWSEQLQREQQDASADINRLTDSFHLNLQALGLLAFAVGLVIAHAAIGLALEQRRPLLRTLRACGVSARVLVTVLGLELLALALLGGVVGVVSGYGLAAALLPDVAASLRGLYGAEVATQLTLSPAWWLQALGLSLGGALLAGGNSLWRAARLPLLALADNEAWLRSHGHWLRNQAWIAAGAATLALAAALWGDSLATGFALMGCVLLAGALGLPVLLNGLLKLLALHVRSVLGQWFVADCRQQLPALSLALMALLLAMAANIGAGSMTEGFRHTFASWLEQRLAAELYVRPQNPEQTAALQTWLQAQPQISAVLPRRDLELRLQGWPSELNAVVDDPLYRQHWPLLASAPGNPWDQLFAGDSLMLSEQLARKLKVGLGDHLVLPSETGTWAPRIVALYADYGNPKGQVLVAATQLLRHWPNQAPSRFAVRTDAANVAALKGQLQATFGLDDTHLIDQGQLKGWALQVFERTFSATTALDSLTLGVAAVALFIGLLTQSQSRLGQLAPLWALGVGRRQLIALALAQTWLLSLLTLLLAVPLGILLAWCLVAVVNVQAFGWRLPLQVFPAQLLRLLGWAMLATALASAWPLLKLLGSRPADLLRVFADER